MCSVGDRKQQALCLSVRNSTLMYQTRPLQFRVIRFYNCLHFLFVFWYELPSASRVLFEPLVPIPVFEQKYNNKHKQISCHWELKPLHRRLSGAL